MSNHAERIVEPPDRFLFLANLQAIPSQNRVIVLGLAIVAGIIMAVNALIGAHDQFVPEAATWFYSHYDTDGDSSSPLFGALAGSGVLGAAVWAMMRNQLRKYMSFRLKRMPTRIAPESVIDIGALIGGRPRVALEHVELRVVAANMEKGQYVRGSGSNRRTVSFSEPTRAVVLYKQQVASIAPGRPIEQYFSGAVDFAPMFSALYPPLRVGKNHGLDIYWEIQLLHPQFVDQELVGPITAFRYDDFLHT